MMNNETSTSRSNCSVCGGTIDTAGNCMNDPTHNLPHYWADITDEKAVLCARIAALEDKVETILNQQSTVLDLIESLNKAGAAQNSSIKSLIKTCKFLLDIVKLNGVTND